MKASNTAFVCGVIALVACGCASPGGLRQGEIGQAVFDQLSDRPADQIAGCFGDKTEAQSGAFQVFGEIDFATRPTASGYSISGVQHLTTGGDTVVLLDLNREAGKTHVKMYTHYLFSNGPPQLFAAIMGCV